MTDAVSTDHAARVDFLAGIHVLELGDGVAGASATNLLWSLGAEVTSVIDPASVHRRGHPSVAAVDARRGAPTSLLSIVLDRGKHLVAVEAGVELDRLLARTGADGGFDLVVADRVGRNRGPGTSLGVDDYADFVAERSQLPWVTISAFGLDGERAADVATELTLAAASGVLASVHDPRTGGPLKLAGWQCLLGTGLTAALAACHALDLSAEGRPSHVELSARDAMIALGPVLELDRLLMNTGNQPGGAGRSGAPAGHYACADGVVQISALEDHHWQGVVEAMGAPGWAAPITTVADRLRFADEIDGHVAAWTRNLTKADAERVLQEHGVPAVVMSSPAELLRSPQLVHRRAFDTVPLGDGRAVQVVGLPFRIVAGRESPRRVRRTLRGLRVLEVSHVLAAPLAGAILGALGAEVTKAEDLGRVDMYRRRGPYIDGEAGAERSAYFTLANHSKRNVVFDVAAHPAKLEALLTTADVVLENLGRRRASALGIDAASLVVSHPDVLAVSSSGFGHDGPHAGYRAYAYNMHTLCGLGHLTRNDCDEAAELDLGWADLVTAYALATTIAAWAVGPSGNHGVGLDFAMADLTVARFNEFLAAASLDPDGDRSFDRANVVSPYAPSTVVPTSDGWVAVSVDGDEEYARLAAALDHGPLADASFANEPARAAHQALLAEHLAAATGRRQTEDLVRALQAEAVGAEPVVRPPDLLADAGLDARGIFTEVVHPVWGRRRIVGIPWRPVGGPALPLGAPPLLAEDDRRPS